MSDCPYHLRLDAFHDGELDADEARRIERHLSECGRCATELAALRDLSARMADLQPGEITPLETARLHREIDGATGRGLLRLSAVLATMAASVLIVSLTWIAQTPTAPTPQVSQSRTTPDWERIAAGENPSRPTVLPGAPGSDTGVASTIDWMLNGIQGLDLHASR